MMVRQIGCCVVLGIAMIFSLLGAIGILRSKNNFAALHCLGLAGVTLPVLTLVGVVMVTGFGVSALKTLAFAIVLLLGAPIGSHAIAVAEHRRKPR
jgi:monovalent cation/proton antiporter MnhG/PhaG subunit